MPALSQADRKLLPLLKDSTKLLCATASLLTFEFTGLTQMVVARSMRMNPGYLAELLGNPEARSVSSKTLREATQGLRALIESLPPLDQTVARQIDEHLSAIETAWGWERQILVQPGDYLPLNARNYIERESDRDLWSRVGVPTTLLVYGPPQSGRSTLVRRCAEQAVSKTQVAFVDLVAPTENWSGGHGPGRERDTDDVCDAIAKAIDEDAECRDWVSLDGLIKGWLENGPATLILDSVNAGPPETVNALLDQIRLWSNRRSMPLERFKPWRRLAVWCVFTNPIVTKLHAEAGYLSRSVGSSNAVRTRWWTGKETETFAANYPDPPSASRQWRTGLLAALQQWFEGQPYLTHAAVQACTGGGVQMTGMTSDAGSDAVESWIASNPLAVRSHLELVAQAAASHPESVRAIDASGVKTWVPFLEELNVIGGSNGLQWTCRLYREQFSRFLARATANTEGA